MASVEEVREKVISIVSEQLNIPKDDIKLDSAFIADLKADSLDLATEPMRYGSIWSNSSWNLKTSLACRFPNRIKTRSRRSETPSNISWRSSDGWPDVSS